MKLIAIGIIAVALILLSLFLYGKPIAAPEQRVVACPADYCEEKIKTAGLCPEWTGKNESYWAQQCYEYPANASSLKECEEKKITYTLVCGVKV